MNILQVNKADTRCGAMRTAWGLYERMGFARSEDLDFLQQGFPVFGFRLPLDADSRKEL